MTEEEMRERAAELSRKYSSREECVQEETKKPLPPKLQAMLDHRYGKHKRSEE
jgi:hypothetical protein